MTPADGMLRGRTIWLSCLLPVCRCWPPWCVSFAWRVLALAALREHVGNRAHRGDARERLGSVRVPRAFAGEVCQRRLHLSLRRPLCHVVDHVVLVPYWL